MTSLSTTELVLEPLTSAHADEMFPILVEPELYRYLDYGPPPSVEHVRNVYTKLEQRESPDGTQKWLNWVVRRKQNGLLGYVQATLIGEKTSWIAYVFGRSHQRHGYAHEATAAMIAHVNEKYGVNELLASVEVENTRSIRLLEKLSFRLAAAPEAAPHELAATERLYVRHLCLQANLTS